MHWSDEYKTEAELREAIKKGRLTKDGVVMDGGRIRVPVRMIDSAPAARQGQAWLDGESPQFVADTAGMSLRDVAAAVGRHPMPVYLSNDELKREAIRQRLGDAEASRMTEDQVAASFVTLVSTSLGDIARFKASQEACNAWRHA